jgi:hypothetical protein
MQAHMQPPPSTPVPGLLSLDGAQLAASPCRTELLANGLATLSVRYSSCLVTSAAEMASFIWAKVC